MNDKKVIEDIIFELMVLASETPISDKTISMATIAALSQFKTEVASHFIVSGIATLQDKGYDEFTALYANFLFANDKDQLAFDLNELAKKLN